MKEKLSERGSITLETGIVLPIFILIFLFIYGLFSVFSAQNAITHALLQTAKSMSLDPYSSERIDPEKDWEKNFYYKLSGKKGCWVNFNGDGGRQWFVGTPLDWSGTDYGEVENVCRERFVNFFANGYTDTAEQTLKAMRVVGGLNGIDFEVAIDGDDMTLTATYKLKYWFDRYGMGQIPMEQTVKTRLWR